MKIKKIGVGIIGAGENGWAARAHLPALQQLSNDFEIVAISTSNLDSATASAKKFNVPNAFDNEYDLVNFPAVELVIVAVKVLAHYHLVKTAIEAGKMVFCEWPLGNGTAEAVELMNLAKINRIKTFVGMQARSLPELKFIRDIIAEGQIGKVLSTTIIGAGDNWGTTLSDKALSYVLDPLNGATMMQIPFAQTVDGAIFCLGEFQNIAAILCRENKETLITETQEIIPQLSDDQVILTGTLKNGAVASIHYRGGVSKSVNLYWEIKGSKGEIVITSPTGHLQFGKIRVRAAINGGELTDLIMPSKYDPTAGGTPGVDAALSRAVYYAYKSIKTDIIDETLNAPDFEAAVKQHRFLDHISKAANQGVLLTLN